LLRPGATVLGAAVAALILTGCSDSSPSSSAGTGARSAAQPAAEPGGVGGSEEWTIALTGELGGDGIGVAFHPTPAPAVVSASATAPLEVCPADVMGRPTDPRLSSWGRQWQSCRPLGEEPVQLPATDGRTHVGIRVGPPDGRPSVGGELRVRWVCQDTHFVLDAPPGSPAPPVPRCDPAGG
jgi:hypothetical protein